MSPVSSRLRRFHYQGLAVDEKSTDRLWRFNTNIELLPNYLIPTCEDQEDAP